MRVETKRNSEVLIFLITRLNPHFRSYAKLIQIYERQAFRGGSGDNS